MAMGMGVVGVPQTLNYSLSGCQVVGSALMQMSRSVMPRPINQKVEPIKTKKVTLIEFQFGFDLCARLRHGPHSHSYRLICVGYFLLYDDIL